jgi:uncharacterized protein
MLVFGLIHGYLLLWTGEILYTYALMGFLVYSFRHLAPKKLFIAAAVLISIGTIWSYADHQSNKKMLANVGLAEKNKAEGTALTKEQKEASTRWEKIQEERSPLAITEYNNSMRKGYLDLVPFLAPPEPQIGYILDLSV